MSESVTEFENAPVVRWTPLATRNDTNYGQWPEPRINPLQSESESVVRPDFSCTGGNNLTIINGLVNGVLPADMIAGGNPVFSFSAASLESAGVAYLVLTASKADGVTSLSIDHAATLPVDEPAVNDGSGTYYLALCDFSKTDGVISVGSGSSGIGSQTFALCRDWASGDATYEADWRVA